MANHIFNMGYVGLQLENGDILIKTYIDEFGEDFLPIFDDVLCDDDDEDNTIAITMNTKLKEILDTKIELNELMNEQNEQILDIESKPVFDQTRKTLVDLIAKIDNLKFKHPSEI
jgi:hypothetical protein